ncbi:MAG TPA: acyltransferase [Candidatus Bilamarchaeaceae archaeon]|nr:acyltransferase [Candidatus Bilamarchaeaceae archaeon]
MRALKAEKTAVKNSLGQWARLRNPFRVAFNFMMIQASRYAPSLRMKRWLLRATGMKVGGGAAVGLMAMFDIFYPELIELGEDCIIGYNATILAHEFVPGELRIGKTNIGRGAMVGANATVLAGVEVGDGAVVSAATFVNADVPAGARVWGNPMRGAGE